MSNELGLTAIGTRLIVRPVNKETISKGGIILPQRSQKKPSIGEVIEAGPECICMKGQVIMYEPLAGTEIVADNEEKLLIMMEHSVMMIMEKAAS